MDGQLKRWDLEQGTCMSSIAIGKPISSMVRLRLRHYRIPGVLLAGMELLEAWTCGFPAFGVTFLGITKEIVISTDRHKAANSSLIAPGR